MLWPRNEHDQVTKEGDEIYSVAFQHCQGRQYSAQAMIWAGLKMAGAGIGTVSHMSGVPLVRLLQPVIQLLCDLTSGAIELLRNEDDKASTHH